MDWSFIWKTILIVMVGTALLRIAGRKSVSQLTIAQTVIMISMGTLLIQPVVGKDVWFTLFIALLMVGILLLMEYAQLKINVLENIITGKSKVLIEDGQLNVKTLKRLRMTVDQLEMKLRQRNVSKISDVEWATLEPNGQLGFMLKEEARPVTMKDLQQVSLQLNTGLSTLLANSTNYMKHQQTIHRNQMEANSKTYTGREQSNDQTRQQDIFKEIKKKEHETPHPKYLQ